MRLELIGIAMAFAVAVAPASAQNLPNKMQGPTQIGEATVAAKLAATAELGRERFRRKAAEVAQKQLEVLADQLREQLAKEIMARRAAEVVAAELLSRAKLEEQIDGERQRLKDAAPAVAPLRAGVGGDAFRLKTLVKDLERKLKAAEWARKLAEAQLKILSGNRER
ncbi:MAG: hypothetical protein ACI89J_001558 [Hyphomicrobiaceae bacterium]|jgi:hypothetical protein